MVELLEAVLLAHIANERIVYGVLMDVNVFAERIRNWNLKRIASMGLVNGKVIHLVLRFYFAIVQLC